MHTIELRNYLLKPGTRDRFINYFKEHFIDAQHDLGAYIPCLYRIKNEPDRFFWIRGFKDMRARSGFLPSFYGGGVWKKYGPAANDMMLEWHNVHLVKPPIGTNPVFEPKEGITVIDSYTTKDDCLDKLVTFFNREYIPFLNRSAITGVTLWTSEMIENDFPRLPVYQHVNLFIVITHYSTEQEYKLTFNRLNTTHKELGMAIKEMIKGKNSLILYPIVY
jgi:hypothetical protein